MSYHAIASHVRERIVRGELEPGSRVPTRVELERRFDSTSITVQRAFDLLSAEGFVVSESTRGTFVASDPPHLSEYVMLFNQEARGVETAYLFNRALRQAAGELRQATFPRLRIETLAHEREQDPVYQSLVQQVEHRSLAGLIFMFTPGDLIGTPLMDAPGVPRLLLNSGGGAPWFAGLPTVYPDMTAFYRGSISWLQARGCRRIAAVGLLTSLRLGTVSFETCLQEAGLAARPWWLQGVSQSAMEQARVITNLLVRGTPEDGRPDGMVIADDHLIEPVLAGIAEAGLTPGVDIQLIGLANFPQPAGDPLRVARLGFQAAEVVQAFIDLTCDIREGRPVEPHTALPPYLVELPPAASVSGPSPPG